MNPIIQFLIGPVLQLVEKFIPDPNLRAQLQLQLLQLQASEEFKQLETEVALAQGQTDINKQEASSGSLFVAGARPAILWVCAGALFSQYILRPFVIWGFAVAGATPPTLPGLDDHLWELMTGMLGMAGWRTVDKFSKSGPTQTIK